MGTESESMARSINQPEPSSRIDSLDGLCLKPAKADLRVNVDQLRLRAIVSDVIQRVSSQKAAALDMGIDQGQLSRQLQTGHLTIERLEKLGPGYAAELGAHLTQTYGSERESPKAYARRLVQQIEACLLELKQFVDGVE